MQDEISNKFLLSHYDTRTNLLDYIAIIILSLCFPLGLCSPYAIGWENGFLENIQLIILFVGLLNCLYLTQGKLRKMWLGVAGIFLLMIGRELSWGRVFFPTGEVDACGQKFISMIDVPGHTFIHAFIFCIIVAIAYILFHNTDFSAIKRIKLPLTSIVICTLSFLVQIVAEHHSIRGYSMPQLQIVEELAEMVCYIEAVRCVNYYGNQLKRRDG
jgi:hypothetical protein